MQLNRRAFVIVLIVLLFVSFPLLLFVLRQNQDVRQRADTSTLAASFGDQVVTKSELEDYIRQTIPTQADEVLASPDGKKYFLNLYLEKKLVETEAKKKNIVVTSTTLSEEKEELVTKKVFSNEKIQSLLANQTALSEYVLKKQVMEDVEAWKEVDMVSVYISPEVKEFAANKKQAQAILEEMRNLVSSSVTLPQAFERLNSKYARQISQMRLQEGLRVAKGNTMESQLKTPLFQVKKGEVSPVIISTGGAMMIVKVLDENATSFDSYDSWLTQQMKGVTYY